MHIVLQATSIICDYASIIQEVWEEKKNNANKLLQAEMEAVIFVAHALKKGKAVLLPSVACVFLDTYCGIGDWSSEQEIYLDTEDSKVRYTNKWLLRQLVMYLQPYMEYRYYYSTKSKNQ